LVPVWIVTGVLAALVLARFMAWDDKAYLAAINAQTPLLFLPAYVVAASAWCFRRMALAIVATAIVAFHVWAVAPTIGSADSVAQTAVELRVVSANVRYSNPTPEKLATELLATDADVLLVQELTPEWVDAFRAAGLEREYRFSFVRQRDDRGSGMGIYSRLPLNRPRIAFTGGWPTMAASVRVGDRSVAIVNVHAIGPSHGIGLHDESVDVIEAVTSSLPHPRIVAGDFNATPYNRTMHRMADLGLVSAHAERGRGLATTWPNGERLSPPVRIDHVLVDPTLVVVDVRELEGAGSDHKPVLVDLAFGG
jgi:endonuclease/exonuclease/phosphatase (EEP) superfamily protein YafD